MNKKRLLCTGIIASIFLIVLLTSVTAETIACYSNTDCFSGFIGNEYCSNNAVFKVFQNSNCVNPGTTESYCNNVNNPTLLLDCGVDSWDPFGANYCKDNNVFHSRNGMHRGCRVINNELNISGCFFEFAFDEELVQTCQNGCSNGACNNVVINCTQNSDCGANGFIDGMFCQSGDVFQNFITYTCINPGNTNSYCTNSINPQMKQDCDNVMQTCSNGQCVSGNISCSTNSDCGANGFIDGVFCQSGNVFQNFITYTCNNPGTVQSSCSNSVIGQLKQTCLSGQTCSNGQCTGINANCSHDSDCGTNSYIGNKFCDNDNVFQDYKQFTCNNPGTANSSCSNNINSRLVEECDDKCSDGECTNGNGNHNMYENPSFNKYNYSEKPYVYPSSINFDAFSINESTQTISGNVVKVESENSLNKILGNNLIIIFMVLIIILIILIIVLSLMR